MQISEHDKQVIKDFVLWLCDKYEIFEPKRMVIHVMGI